MRFHVYYKLPDGDVNFTEIYDRFVDANRAAMRIANGTTTKPVSIWTANDNLVKQDLLVVYARGKTGNARVVAVGDNWNL